jgi:RNA polymerase-associated protein RTF1
MAMSEFEREEILAQRLEQLQRIQDKRNLEKMVKDQSARAAEVDSVSKAAKRLSYLSFSPTPR